MKWMITCKEATIYISKKEEGRLSVMQHIKLFVHLGTCSLCKLFYKQNKIIIQNTPKIQTGETLTPQTKADIIEKLKREL